jgi:hypothetical protein
MIQPELGIVTYAPKTNILKLVCVRGGIPDVTSVTDQDVRETLHALFYPNPTTGLVTIDASVRKATIYTMDGQLLTTIDNAYHQLLSSSNK